MDRRCAVDVALGDGSMCRWRTVLVCNGDAVSMYGLVALSGGLQHQKQGGTLSRTTGI